MTRFATLVDALTALPVGPEAIADHLAASGVQAVCGEPRRCAIADYLTRTVEIPAGHGVYVSERAASIRGGNTSPARWTELVWFDVAHRVTDAGLGRPDITEFIENFDRGRYPDLVEGTFVPEQVAA